MSAEDPQPYIDYYSTQAGGGFPVFRGSRTQRGHGLGNLLSSVVKTVTPLFIKGVRRLGSTMGKAALRGGLQTAKDVLQGTPVKHAVKRRASEAGEQLLMKAQRMIESDHPPGQPAQSRPIKRGPRRTRFTPPQTRQRTRILRRKTTPRDIFA